MQAGCLSPKGARILRADPSHGLREAAYMSTIGKHVPSHGRVFDPGNPLWLSEECETQGVGVFLRAKISRGHVDEVQECYRTMAVECVRRGCTRLLIVGSESDDAYAHRALNDALRSLSVAGFPRDFRLALVPASLVVAAVYDAVITQAVNMGIAARRFRDERAATAWLRS